MWNDQWTFNLHYATGNQRQVKFMREGSLFPGWKPVFTTEGVDGGACSQFTVVTASSLHAILIKIESLSTCERTTTLIKILR